MRSANENAATLRDFIKKLKVYPAKSQELQTLYNHKQVKQRSYRTQKFVWLDSRHIKMKQNPKLEHKYLDPFQIEKAMRNQAYRLSLPAK